MRLPPLVVFFLPVLAGWLAAWAWPGSTFAFPGQGPMALIIMAAAVVILLLAVTGFRLKRTTVNPLKPEQVSTLVTGGVYRLSRNPMYLGMALAAGGISLWFGHAAGLIALPLAIAYINKAQIQSEEAVLAERFGADYLDYCKQVRRWI